MTASASAEHALSPLPPGATSDEVFTRFLEAITAKGLQLYPEQEEALLELFSGKHVILNTPTGSGKSLVAGGLHFKGLCAGERTVYTCPIKALVNEKFLALCRDFGPENVGMMTGDATVNGDALVLCCTAEILSNIALGGGSRAQAIRAVIMDEFHYYSDAERGTAWQVPLLTMPHVQFLLMSATLGETRFLQDELTERTGQECVVVRGDRRPVPLEFEYSETRLSEKVQELLTGKRAPIYLVFFTQRAASEAAQDLMSLAVSSRDERDVLAAELETAKFNSPYGKEMKRWLRHGIGVHHAGLLPKYRVLVEKLAQRGLLKLICGTDTLGVGINVPIRTVVFSQLWKYDGKKAAILSVRDFRQVAGRAGRKGFDDRGYVVVQAPEHVIENKRAEEKAAADPRKAKKVVKARAPEGAVGWDHKTFERLMTAAPEALTSRFEVSHGMLLLALSRDEDGCRVLKKLIQECHEPPVRKQALRRKAWQLFRSLLERRIVEWIPATETGRKLRVNVELQADFSLHQTLSLFLLDTLPLLDRAAPDYAVNVLTLCEAILEDPDVILRRQVDRLKSEKLAELKAAGVSYEERMEKLEEIEHPKPLRDFLYDAFNRFAAAHPWVGQENVRPKSVAREMFEGYVSFSEYIRAYELERSEGLLLRHLAQVWKVLAQTVPDGAKTEEVFELEGYLEELVKGVDASLLEEWESLRHPSEATAVSEESEAKPPRRDIARDLVALKRAVRAVIFAFLREISGKQWEEALGHLREFRPEEGAVLQEAAKAVEQGFEGYFAARGRFRLDPEGRAAERTHWGETTADADWEVCQVLVDTNGANDWEAVFALSWEETRSKQRPILRWSGVRPIGET